ncbi:acylphosphatase [uncultured Helicobacter sp.]|uniref:acylphosphatase n=1 Tax=uncultured Helicobacter sp. TaxID=175537 RepID=UPI00374E6DF5
MQTYYILVFGKVQGVGYRKFAKYHADKLGIQGSTRNLEDGSVEIYAQAEQKVLDVFIQYLHSGPERSDVVHIQSQKIVPRDFNGFVILK